MKSIFTILLLISLQSFGQHYFVIPTMNNPENKARMISKRFYQLSQPAQGSDVTEFAFGWIKHPTNDSVALVIDTAMWHPKGGISAADITNWITAAYPTITTTQRNTLTNYINQNSLLRISRLILTARIKLWRRSELEARGWSQTQILN